MSEHRSGDADEGGTEGAPSSRRFVTALLSIEQQIGMHVMTALRATEVAAVLTTIVEGPDGVDRIVSIGLTPDQARAAAAAARISEDGSAEGESGDRVPCVGFHCFLPREGQAQDERKP